MNTTAVGSCFSLINPETLKIGQTVALSLILVVSLVGNSLIVLIVYKTPTLRKPINMLIANMAMSDLLYPIFLFPVRLAEWHAGSWLIGGTLGQALCKIYVFFADFSSLVSIQSLVLITVDRFVAVVVPLRSPLVSRKLCLFFIVATWIVAMAVHSPYLVAYKLVKYPERPDVQKSVAGSLRGKHISKLRLSRCYRVFLHSLCPLGDTVLHHPDQA